MPRTLRLIGVRVVSSGFRSVPESYALAFNSICTNCVKAGETATARTLAALPEGSRIVDYTSLGVIIGDVPVATRTVLAGTGKVSQREWDLPAHVMVYYAIGLALYMQSSYRECCGVCSKRIRRSRSR